MNSEIIYKLTGLFEGFIGLVIILFFIIIFIIIFLQLHSQFISKSNTTNWILGFVNFHKGTSTLGSIELNFQSIYKKYFVDENYYTLANIYLVYVKLLQLENRNQFNKEIIASCLPRSKDYINKELQLIISGIVFLYYANKNKDWNNKKFLQSVKIWELKSLNYYERIEYFQEFKKNLNEKKFFYQNKENKYLSSEDDVSNIFNHPVDFPTSWKIHFILIEIEISRELELTMKKLSEIGIGYHIGYLIELKGLVFSAMFETVSKKVYIPDFKIDVPLTLTNFRADNTIRNFKRFLTGYLLEFIIPKQSYTTSLTGESSNKVTRAVGYLKDMSNNINRVRINIYCMKDDNYSMKITQHFHDRVYMVDILLNAYQYESYLKGDDADTRIKDTLFLYPNKSILEYSVMMINFDNNLKEEELEIDERSSTHDITSLQYSSKLLK